MNNILSLTKHTKVT